MKQLICKTVLISHPDVQTSLSNIKSTHVAFEKPVILEIHYCFLPFSSFQRFHNQTALISQRFSFVAFVQSYLKQCYREDILKLSK